MHFLTSTQILPKVRLISLTVMLLVFLSGKAIAQCGFIPGFGCSFTDYTNYGINSSNPQTLEYDNFLSAFHSTVIRNSDGVFMIWGETAASNGTGSLLVPTEINAANFPGLTGIPLKVTMGSEAVKHQKILLTSEGLFAWGSAGIVISTNIKSTDAFGKITVNGKSDGLPAGVSPGDVKMMFASTKVLAIVTCEGSVYMLAADNKENQGDGTALHNSSWAKVKTSDTGHPDLANVVAVRGSTNTLMALTSDNEVYTWGYKTLLGDGATYNLTARDYATKMTLPDNSQIKMIGVTSYDRNHDKNQKGSDKFYSDDPTYYLLYSNQKIYAMGNNDLKQLGDFTSVSRNDWVQPRYPLNKVTGNTTAGDVMDDIIWMSANGHDIRWPGINVINNEYRLWNWGSNAGSMLGRTSTSQDNNTNTPFNPGQPLSGGNFNPQTSNILTVETGGHTTMIIQQCEQNFGYVGHAIHGSTAAGLDGDTHYPTFIFNTSTVKICGLDAVPDIAFTGNPTTTIVGDAVCRDQKIELVGEPLGGVFTVEDGPGEITNGNLLSFTGTQTSGTVKIRYTVPLSTCVNKYVERNVQFGPCAVQKISGKVWIDKNSNAEIDTGEPGTNASASGYNGLWANLILEGTTNDDNDGQGCSEPNVTGTTYVTAKDGDWNSNSTWVGGNKPGTDIGEKNKVVILHNVTKSGTLTPAKKSVLVIKDGGALTLEGLQISKSNSTVIVNYGTIHLTTGDLIIKSSSSATICAFHACIMLDEGQINLQKESVAQSFSHTSIHQVKKDLVSKADIVGEDIRIWLEDGEIINQGFWYASTISFWRASDGQTGLQGTIPLQSSALEIDAKMNSCQIDFCNSNNVGKVQASVPVAADGTYQLTLPAGCIYTVQISAFPVAKGTILSPDDAQLPEGWVYTGNNIENSSVCLVPACEHPNRISGIIVDGQNVTGINFGIKGKPMISGTIYQDGNGLNNGAVDGKKVYGLSSDYSAIGHPQLYVQMLDENNIVLKYAPVKSDGTYLITDVTDNNLTLQLTTVKTEPGNTAIAPVPPASWYYVGENFGIGNLSGTGVNDGTGTGSNGPATRYDGKISVVFPTDGTPISKVDFGIELPPVADAKHFDMVPPGEFTVPSEASLPGFPKVDSYQYISMTHPLLEPLSGSDPEDCKTPHSCSTGKTFTIHSINSHTKLFYDFGGTTGVQEILPVTNGPVEIKNFNPAKMVIYGEIGYGTPDQNFEFYYSLTDAADIVSDPVPYSITTTSILPIRLLQLAAQSAGSKVDLKWSATVSQNGSRIEIQRSEDGINWETIGMTTSDAGMDADFLLSRNFIDNNPLAGKNMYRLKQTDVNGGAYFSLIRTVTVSQGNTISMYPNPASSKVNLKGLNGWCHIQIYDMAGRLVQTDRTDKNLYEADVSRLPEGTYNLIVIDESGKVTTFKLRKK